MASDVGPEERIVFVAELKLGPLAAALQRGERNLLVLVDEICDRIHRVDAHIMAFLPEPRRRERLVAEARALMGRFPTPAYRPPLFGIPVGVKDVFRVDGFPTRAGSRLPPEVFAGAEAQVVTTLRAAGALVVGKTVTSEFAYSAPGPTRNPHNPAFSPGGSSSGSAAAVASGMCALGLGSQTIGSIIRPAALCGIVGFKPTYERIPRAGLVPFCEATDHVGLMAQDVEGLALVSSVLCREWRAAPAVLRRPVLGVPEGKYLEQASLEILAAFEARLARLRELGYSVRRVDVFDDIETINARHRRMVAAGAAQVHRDWFENYRHLYSEPMSSLIDEGRRIPVEALAKDLEDREELRASLAVSLHSEGIDLWIAPSTLTPAPRNLAAPMSPLMSLPWTHAGVPSLTLPAGFSALQLPLGVQLVGGFGDDERLLRWGAELAQALV